MVVNTANYYTERPTITPSRPVPSRVAQTAPPSHDVKYISLGPNIYGQVRTLFATYTYFTIDDAGEVEESSEVIKQVSTSLFSTTALPKSVTIDSGFNLGAQVQLTPDEATSLKSAFQSSTPPSVTSGTLPTAQPQIDPSSESDSAANTRPSSSGGGGSSETTLSSPSSQSSSGTGGSRPSVPPTSPITAINLPSGGAPAVTRPPSSGISISPSRPISSGSPGASSVSSTQEQLNNDSEESEEGGVIDAVVEGIGGVLSNPPNVNLAPVLDAVATLLRGPIRSAIANRRSELNSNRKSESAVPSEERSRPLATLPAFVRLPPEEPNFIPVGGLAKSQSVRRPAYEFIPLNQREQNKGDRNNGPVPPPQRRDDATARIDIHTDASTDLNGLPSEPVVTIPKELYDKLKTQRRPDEPIFLDDDRLIINDHIIKSTDPHIIDVLNRFEQSHLFGKYEGQPMSIKIVPGLPMNLPKQVEVPAQTDVVYIPPLEQLNLEQANNPRSPPPPSVHGPRKPVPRPNNRPFSARPPSPPPPPPVRNRPNTRPNIPLKNRPNTLRNNRPKKQAPPPSNNLRGRPPPPAGRPLGVNSQVAPPGRPRPQGHRPLPPPLPPRPGPRPLSRPQGQRPPINSGRLKVEQHRPLPNVGNNVDLDDSVNEFSINNEVVVQAPPNVISAQSDTHKSPKPTLVDHQSTLGGPSSSLPRPQFPKPSQQHRPPHQGRPHQGRPIRPQFGVPQGPQFGRPPPSRPLPLLPNAPRSTEPPVIRPRPPQSFSRPPPQPPSIGGYPRPSNYATNEINNDNQVQPLPPRKSDGSFKASKLDVQANNGQSHLPPPPRPVESIIPQPPSPKRPSLPPRRPPPIRRPAPSLSTPTIPGQNDRRDGLPNPITIGDRPKLSPRPNDLRPGLVTDITTERTYRRPPPRPLNRLPGEYTPIDNPSQGPPLDPNSPGYRERVNPNKARKPTVIPRPPQRPVPVIGSGNQIISTKYEKETPPPVSSSTTLEGQLPYVDPSFTVSAGYQGSRETIPVTTGSFVSQSDRPRARPGDPSMDYQGWYTEGDSAPLPPPSSSSAVNVIPYTIREKEGSKTTTYANEWATVDPSRTRINFEPLSKPSVNTNFEREWTVRDEIVEPTRPLVDLSRTRPYQSRYTNEWGSYVVRQSDELEKPPVSAFIDEEEPLNAFIDEKPYRYEYQNPPPRPTIPQGKPIASVEIAPVNEENQDVTNGSIDDIGLETGRDGEVTGSPEDVKPQPPTPKPEPRPQRPYFGPFNRPSGYAPTFGPRLSTSPSPEVNNGPIGGPIRRPSFPPRPPTRGTGSTEEVPIELEGSYEPNNRPLRERPARPFLSVDQSEVGVDPSGPGSSSLIEDQLPPGIEPDTGTFININPSSKSSYSNPDLARPTRLRPPIRPSLRPSDSSDLGTADNLRPNVFIPRVSTEKSDSSISTEDESTTQRNTTPLKGDSDSTSTTSKKYQLAGSPFALPGFGKEPDKNDEVKRKEIIGNNIDGAIVESIPGNALSAEDSDPETKCQNTCGKNEICQISRNRITCKCRPGFGKLSRKKPCESEFVIVLRVQCCSSNIRDVDFSSPESKSYQVEVLTASESEEITVVRISPKAVHAAVEETFRNSINVGNKG